MVLFKYFHTGSTLSWHAIFEDANRFCVTVCGCTCPDVISDFIIQQLGMRVRWHSGASSNQVGRWLEKSVKAARRSLLLQFVSDSGQTAYSAQAIR